MPFFSVRCSTCDPVVLGGQPVGELAGAVGRAVVDDQHAKALGGRAREHLAGRRDDRLHVLGLVVGGQYQPRLAGHRPAYPRAWPAAAPGDRAPYADATLVGVPAPEPSNAAIADALEELGDLYELDGAIVHRVLAYRDGRARRCARRRSRSPALAREGRATELPGIGKTLQEKILALSRPARSRRPRGCARSSRRACSRSRGCPASGPSARGCCTRELGIDSPQALREAALAERLRDGARASARSSRRACSQALDELDAARRASAAPRILLPRALEIGEALATALRELGGGGHARAARGLGAPRRPTASRTST